MNAADQPPIGLIAGHGRLPFLVAHGVRQAGRPLVVAGLEGLCSPRLGDLADAFNWVGICRVGEWIRRLRKEGVHQAIMVGAVRKREMYTRFRLLRYIPDLRTMKLWYIRLRKDRRDNAVLCVVADELASCGVELISSVHYCKEHLAHEGVMTHRGPAGLAVGDADFGWRIARASARLDIGQALAVKERDIIAVEAMEGTDAMIRRAGRLCRTGGWTLIKVARPNQDMRFDVPTIGPRTIRNLRDAGCSCLVVEAGKTLIVDKSVTLELADRLGIAVIGKTPEASPAELTAAPV